jgi:hypothetical protein
METKRSKKGTTVSIKRQEIAPLSNGPWSFKKSMIPKSESMMCTKFRDLSLFHGKFSRENDRFPYRQSDQEIIRYSMEMNRNASLSMG